MRIEFPTCPKCGQNAIYLVERVFVYSGIRVSGPDGQAEYTGHDDHVPDDSEPQASDEGLTRVQCEKGHEWISYVDFI
jgi:hypothetical protein